MLFIQGIAEGTNIFQTTPHGSYEATIFKLDLSAIDTTTQTRYRVGVKGRADGKFIHTVSTSLSTADMLTIDEINQLQNTLNKKQLLIEIEKKILQESQQNNVAYEFVANRRDFIANIFKLSTASLMINPFADMLNKTFNKKILHTNDLKADENIEYPPGIINCRDPAIKTAYRLSCMDQGDYVYKYSKEIGAILAGVLALKKSWVPDFGRILLDTPFKEPAYWYICAKIDDYPHGKYKDKILEKKNEPIFYFKNGIAEYFEYWIRNEDFNKRYIEENFLSAIFTAAGKDANEYKTFLAKNIDERKQYLQDIMKIFEDMEFDKKEELHSIPALVGERGAIFISGMFHLFSIIFWALFAAYAHLKFFGWLAVIIAAVMLYYEQKLVREDFKNIPKAFFDVNGYLGIVFLILIIL